MAASVNLLSDISNLFDDDFLLTFAAWYLLPEKVIIDSLGRAFSHKNGSRPVVVLSISGPNVMVFPRSTTGDDGIPHAAHSHLGECCLNEDGHVIDNCAYTLATSIFTSDEYSCLEPEQSALWHILERGGRR